MTIIKKLALAASVAAIGIAAPAQAASYTAPTASGDATVRLYTAIDLTKVSDLDFGVVIRDGAYAGGSSVTLASDGSVGCAAADLSCTGASSAGEFTITGDDNSDMSVTLDAGADFDPISKVLILRNGTASVDLTLDWSGMSQDVDPNTTDALNTFSVTGDGSAQTILLYGSLLVPASSASAPNGTYSKTFSLTADYK